MLIEAVIQDTGEVVAIGPKGLELPGRATIVALELPDGLSFEEWSGIGASLQGVEHSMRWWIGDWLRYGERKYGEKYSTIESQYSSAANAKWVAGRFEFSRRRENLPWSHHAEVAKLPPPDADQMLDLATKNRWSQKELRAQIKGQRREKKCADLSARATVLPTNIQYPVILADPPWRFEPYSRITGMDRAADNHYPTMTLEDILALKVPALDDAVLFLWATAPMLVEALEVMKAWGFKYKSHIIWAKDRMGTGYWARSKHEPLLIGTRGSIPAPLPGTQPESVIYAPVAEHSRKPETFHEIIEAIYPDMPRLEMFSRATREGWHGWGKEVGKFDQEAA